MTTRLASLGSFSCASPHVEFISTVNYPLDRVVATSDTSRAPAHTVEHPTHGPGLPATATGVDALRAAEASSTLATGCTSSSIPGAHDAVLGTISSIWRTSRLAKHSSALDSAR